MSRMAALTRAPKEYNFTRVIKGNNSLGLIQYACKYRIPQEKRAIWIQKLENAHYVHSE